jgi:hypothetical protein
MRLKAYLGAALSRAQHQLEHRGRLALNACTGPFVSRRPASTYARATARTQKTPLSVFVQVEINYLFSICSLKAKLTGLLLSITGLRPHLSSLVIIY